MKYFSWAQIFTFIFILKERESAILEHQGMHSFILSIQIYFEDESCAMFSACKLYFR